MSARRLYSLVTGEHSTGKLGPLVQNPSAFRPVRAQVAGAFVQAITVAGLAIERRLVMDAPEMPYATV